MCPCAKPVRPHDLAEHVWSMGGWGLGGKCVWCVSATVGEGVCWHVHAAYTLPLPHCPTPQTLVVLGETEHAVV
jgi:hypothetical protein